VKIVSWLMLVVFLLGVAPKEYLHDALFDHEDTVHPEYKKGELVITHKHTHCSFLGFVLAPFIAAEKQFLLFEEVIVHSACYLLPGNYFNYTAVHTAISLRGPPAFSC